MSNPPLEITPCPFCGCAMPSDGGHEDDCYFTVLAKLKAAPPADCSLIPAVLAAWNRRASQPAAPALPEGFRLLPEEATGAMMDAEWNVSMSEAHSNGGVSAAAWRAMVEAAPQVTYGNGHSGPGWYMHDAEYPEEGAVFLSGPAGWRPIDQRKPMQDQPHPEPGEVVLVWVVAEDVGEDDKGNEIRADASTCDLGEYQPPHPEGGDGWMVNFQGSIGSGSWISHWMPLPAAPKADAALAASPPQTEQKDKP